MPTKTVEPHGVRARGPVWLSRLALVAPLIGVFIWPLNLLTLGIHSRNDWWPYGRMHEVWQPILVLISYGVLGVLFLTVGFCVGALMWNTVRCVCCSAFRVEHRTFGSYLAGGEPEWIKYSKPDPLVRGRIGMR